jgi:hypothetical protein
MVVGTLVIRGLRGDWAVSALAISGMVCVGSVRWMSRSGSRGDVVRTRRGVWNFVPLVRLLEVPDGRFGERFKLA